MIALFQLRDNRFPTGREEGGKCPFDPIQFRFAGERYRPPTNTRAHRPYRGTRRKRLGRAFSKGLGIIIRGRVLISSTGVEGKKARRYMNGSNRGFMRISRGFHPYFLGTLVSVARATGVFQCICRVMYGALFRVDPFVFNYERGVQANRALCQYLSAPIRGTKRNA